MKLDIKFKFNIVSVLWTLAFLSIVVSAVLSVKHVSSVWILLLFYIAGFLPCIAMLYQTVKNRKKNKKRYIFLLKLNIILLLLADLIYSMIENLIIAK